MVGNFEKIETPNLRPRSVKNPRGRIRRLVRGIAGHKITGLIPRPVMLPGAKWSFPLPLDDNLNVDPNPASGFICFASLPQAAHGSNHFQNTFGVGFPGISGCSEHTHKTFPITGADCASYHSPGHRPSCV